MYLELFLIQVFAQSQEASLDANLAKDISKLALIVLAVFILGLVGIVFQVLEKKKAE